MGLNTGKKDIKSAFEKAWTQKYIGGLLVYAQRSNKKVFVDILAKLDEAG